MGTQKIGIKVTRVAIRFVSMMISKCLSISLLTASVTLTASPSLAQSALDDLKKGFENAKGWGCLAIGACTKPEIEIEDVLAVHFLVNKNNVVKNVSISMSARASSPTNIIEVFAAIGCEKAVSLLSMSYVAEANKPFEDSNKNLLKVEKASSPWLTFETDGTQMESLEGCDLSIGLRSAKSKWVLTARIEQGFCKPSVTAGEFVCDSKVGSLSNGVVRITDVFESANTTWSRKELKASVLDASCKIGFVCESSQKLESQSDILKVKYVCMDGNVFSPGSRNFLADRLGGNVNVKLKCG